MSAASVKPARAPYFTANVDVDVDIDPSDLEDAGWVYVGKGKNADEGAPSDEEVVLIVQRWHEDTHDGPWRWCTHPLCDELRDRS